MQVRLKEIITIVASQLETSADRQRIESPISESTYLVRDLGFSSVEFVVIFEKIQRIRQERIDFIDLIMPDRSTYVEDLSIADIVRFVGRENSSAAIDSQTDPYENRREPISQSDIDLLNKAIRHQSYEKEIVQTRSPICFILSAPRSGSTLLRRMLGCHPEVYAPMELHLMTYQDFAQRKSELSDEEHAHLLEGTIVARQEIRGMNRKVSVAVEQMYVRDQRPVTQFFSEIDPYLEGRILIDKTPTYAFSKTTVERLESNFPEARFIHLTRRPNAVIKSLIDSELGQLMRFRDTSGIKHNRFAEALWCLCEQNIRETLSDNSSRSMRISYEALVREPLRAMNRIHRFLEISPSDNIDPYASTDSLTDEKVERYAGDLKTYLRSGIDSRVATEWEKFSSLHWLSEPTEELVRDEKFLEESREDPC